MMSKVLQVSKSGYYKWKRNCKVNTEKYKDIDTQIKQVFKASAQTYGSPRIAESMGFIVSKNTVARRMSALNLVARPKRKYINTTDSDHGFKVAKNLLNRNFDAYQPNSAWVSDITYIRVGNYWMYLTIILDLADRMIVGWSLSKNMTAHDTVIAAFRNAAKNRRLPKNSKLMLHSDRGVQYACKEFRSLLTEYGCIQSMSRKANCWDNAVAESFFKTIKTECTNRYIFINQKVLSNVLFRYIDGWYNTIRIHSSLGGKSPLQMFKFKTKNMAA